MLKSEYRFSLSVFNVWEKNVISTVLGKILLSEAKITVYILTQLYNKPTCFLA